MSTGIPENFFGDFVFVNFLPKHSGKTCPKGRRGRSWVSAGSWVPR